MGQQVKELFDWARRRKIFGCVFVVALTLTVGILIGSVVSGRVSAMKTSFAGTNATRLAVQIQFLPRLRFPASWVA